jgi:DNA-binding transcriptional LysR family regulator
MVLYEALRRPEERDAMDMRRMRYFLTLAEHRHFGRAATCLGISQPALSQQVRRLEEEFGAVLIERTSRSIALTAAGSAILAPIRSCLASYEEAVLAARAADDESAGRLRIGFPGAEVDWTLLPALLRRMSELLPDTRLEVVEASCEQQAAELRQQRIDAGFMHLPVGEDGLAAMRLRQDELVVLLPRNHPFAGTDPVPLGLLADEPFIDFQVHCHAYAQALSSLVHSSGITPRMEYGSTGLGTTIEMVASRLGVAIAASSAVQQPHEEIVVRALRPAGRALDIAFVWRLGDNSAGLRALRQLIAGRGGEPRWSVAGPARHQGRQLRRLTSAGR